MKIKKIIRFSFIYYNNFLQDLIYIKNSSQNKLKNCNIGYKISQQIQKMKKKGGRIYLAKNWILYKKNIGTVKISKEKLQQIFLMNMNKIIIKLKKN